LSNGKEIKMKKIVLCGLFAFLVGCVGSPTPTNPMERIIPLNQPWWTASTVGVTKDKNPWEKFVLPHVVDDNLDPWGSYEQPKLFPKDFEPGKDALLEDTKYHLRLKHQLRYLRRKLKPKVEKSGLSPLEELKKREREYFKRQRLQERSI
jgi:hypothetical protein